METNNANENGNHWSVWCCAFSCEVLLGKEVSEFYSLVTVVANFSIY